MGLPHSHRVSRVLCYSGTPRMLLKFRLRGCYSILPSFPTQFNYINVLTICGSEHHLYKYNGLGSYPFARHYLGNRCFTFFSSRYLDGSVPWVPFSYTIYSCMDTSGLMLVCFHIQKSSDHGLFATPRSLSQLITSFIGA